MNNPIVEFAKNIAVPIGLIILWGYIALALIMLQFPLNYVFGIVIPTTSIYLIAHHYYKKRAQWLLDDRKFLDEVKLEQLSDELKAKAQSG